MASLFCRHCGKPLTDPKSIEREYGPECWAMIVRSQHSREEPELFAVTCSANDLNEYDVVSWPQAMKLMDELGIPRSRLKRAAGGNLGMGAIHPYFRIYRVGNRRYFRRDILRPDAIEMLRSLDNRRKAQPEPEQKPELPDRTEPDLDPDVEADLG